MLELVVISFYLNAELSSEYNEEVKGYYYLMENCKGAMKEFPDSYDVLTSKKTMSICRDKNFRSKKGKII